MTRPRSIGMPWYRPEDYARLRSILVDGDRLPASYEQWLLSAEQVAREVARSGVEVRRIVIEPDAFTAWCEENGVARDSAARSRFASEPPAS